MACLNRYSGTYASSQEATSYPSQDEASQSAADESPRVYINAVPQILW